MNMLVGGVEIPGAPPPPPHGMGAQELLRPASMLFLHDAHPALACLYPGMTDVGPRHTRKLRWCRGVFLAVCLRVTS